MKKLENKLTIFLSHDVDTIHQAPLQGLYYFITQKKAKYLWSLFAKHEPYWRFEKIMALEKKYHVRSTFFFLEEKTQFNLFKPITWRLINDRYNFSDPRVKNLLQKLDRGGWEVGLHGSYSSYRNTSLMRQEKENLEKSLGHKVIGIRQHHLNLDIPETWQIQAKVGFGYDATYGFKKNIGWRGQKYLPFKPLKNDFLAIPLAFMDINLFQGDLTGNNLDKLWQECEKIIDRAQKQGALLSILWHNRFFNNEQFPGFIEIYERIIQECQKRQALFTTGEQIYRMFKH